MKCWKDEAHSYELHLTQFSSITSWEISSPLEKSTLISTLLVKNNVTILLGSTYWQVSCSLMLFS